MNVGQNILTVRKDQNLTQAEFGKLFHVTRQTVSNWENGKSYPDLQILTDISDRFQISLDKLIKEDPNMVKRIDQERMFGTVRRERSITDFFTGAGTGLMASGLFSPASPGKIAAVIGGLLMIAIGWYRKAQYDRKVMTWFEETEEE